MVNLLSRDQALAELKPYDGIEIKEFAPNGSYGFKKQGNVYVYQFGDKKDVLPVDNKAWDYVYRNSGLRGTAVDKLPTKMHEEHVVPIVNHYFKSSDNDMRALVKDGAIMGFARADQPAENPRDLFLMAEKAIGKKNIRGYQVMGDLSRNYFAIVGNDERKLGKTYNRDGKKVGTTVGYGISTYSSPLALPGPGSQHSLELNGFNWVLACTNGAVSAQNVSHFTRKEAGDTPFREWYPEHALEVYNAAEVEYDRLHSLQGVKLPPYTAEMVDSLMEQYGVPPVIRGKVADRLINLPVDDLLGLWNHITYVASNYSRVLDDPSLVRRLQLSAASIVRNQHICDKCHQIVKPRKRLNQEVVQAFEEQPGNEDRNN